MPDKREVVEYNGRAFDRYPEPCEWCKEQFELYCYDGTKQCARSCATDTRERENRNSVQSQSS